jgi:hypothetical protein
MKFPNPAGSSLRGLPWYLSVLMALCGAGSILLLWLTHLSDPGALQPRAEKGEACRGPFVGAGAGASTGSGRGRIGAVAEPGLCCEFLCWRLPPSAAPTRACRRRPFAAPALPPRPHAPSAPLTPHLSPADPTVARLEAGLPVPDGGGASNYRRDARGVWLRSEELEGWNGPLVSKCAWCRPTAAAAA